MKWLLALLTLIGLSTFQLSPVTAQQWLPGGQGIPIVCAFNTSPPVVATNAFVYAQCSNNGTLLGGGGGGGGGPVTLAAGSVSAGAYTTGSFVAGALVDGAITTLGTEADTAWTSGNGTVISVLKKIAGGITVSFATAQHVIIDSATLGTVTVTGTVTANGAANVTPTACDSTITTGGTAQTAIAAQTTLHGFTIDNTDASAGSGEPLWISLTTTAAAGTAGSHPLAPPTATTFAGMGSYTTPPGFGTNHAVSIVAATTGHKFGCFWW